MQNQISVQSKNYLHTLLKNYSKIGNNENNGIDRVALTREDKKGRDYFIELLKANNFEIKQPFKELQYCCAYILHRYRIIHHTAL